MAKNLRAVVTIEKAQVTTSYVKDEAVTSYQKAEAVASRTDFSINQWFYDSSASSFPTAVLLSEIFVTVLNKNLTETLTLSEAPALAFNKPTTETLSLLEAFAKVVTWNKSFTDAFTLDDAAQIDKDYYGVKGNVAFMLDVIGLSTAKIATETITVGDVYTAAVNKVVTENLSLIETQVKSYNTAKADNFSATDLFSMARGLNKSDSVSFSDIYYAALNKIVTDSMTMTEVVGIGTGIPITESFSISDSIISEINKVIADAFTLDDSALIDKDYYGNKGNICTVSDVIALAITWVRGYSDSISTSDSASIANISGKVLNGASFNRITLN
jgi:transcriptional regulator with PAS, ATPase and Fis domain